MGGQDINESQDTLGNLRDKAHTIQHAATSTADHTFPSGTANYLRADGTWTEPPTGSGTPSGTVVAETAYGAGTAAGTSSEYSRGDHTHGSPADLVPTHAALASGIHGTGTSNVASTADITVHAALTTVHSLGTMAQAASADYASTTVYAAHTATDAAHGAGTIASVAAVTAQITTHAGLTGTHGAGTVAALLDVTTHAGLTGTHGAGTVASMTALNAHTTLTAAHGVAGTIADKADITDTVLVTADVTTNNVTSTKHGFVPKSTSNTAQFLRNDTTPTWATPAGGSDPWTYLTLSAAFTTSSATAQAVTGLAFTPSANTKYDIFGMFYVQTASSAIVPRVGLAWPSGLTNGVATIYITAGASTQYLVNLNSVAGSGLTSVGAIASTANWPLQMNSMVNAGATPSGSLQVQFCSEGAGTQVTMAIGSYLKYRSYT